MIRRPPRSTRVRSSAASDVYKRQLQELVAICKGLLKEVPRNEAREARAKEFAEIHDNIRAAWYQEMLGCANDQPIAVPWLAEQIWQEIKSTDWVITNGTLKGWARKLWDCLL